MFLDTELSSSLEFHYLKPALYTSPLDVFEAINTLNYTTAKVSRRKRNFVNLPFIRSVWS